MAKSKRKMLRVSKEYSGLAIFIIFMILLSNFAFSPQTGGMPRSVSNAYVPTAISSSSLPLGGAGLNDNVEAWLDAVEWLNNNAERTDVVSMWWDYGNWLSDLGNVTSLADNTTVNSTQIENLGFSFMANENQSLNMLSNYGQDRVKYAAIFTTLYAYQFQAGSNQFILYPGNYGDEGKWVWMARISSQGMDRIVNQGFIDQANAWYDSQEERAETYFGQSNSTTGLWDWNAKGQDSVIYKLLGFAKTAYATRVSAGGVYQVNSDVTVAEPTYFKEAYFAGLDTAPNQYGGLVPIIAIYEIDWDAYNEDNP